MAVELILSELFPAEEAKRVDTHLQKLLPYLNLESVVVVGGLTIRYHLVNAGINYPPRPFNDLDLVAKSPDDVSSAVIKDFLVSHYHPPRGNSFYLVLVDPETKTKVDIFDYSHPPREMIKVKFRNFDLSFQSIEDQLTKTVLDCLKVVENLKIDPKQFQDAKLLMNIANPAKAEENWRSRNLKQYPSSLVDTFKLAEKTIAANPQLLVVKPWHRPGPFDCPDCINTPKFPLTPKEQIYKTLGYIE